MPSLRVCLDYYATTLQVGQSGTGPDFKLLFAIIGVAPFIYTLWSRVDFSRVMRHEAVYI